MAKAIYGGPVSACNTILTMPTGSASLLPDTVSHPLITPYVQIALLAALNGTGGSSLGDLADAIPAHPQPISAVLALVDAGLLGIDLVSAFDASCRVWRNPPARH
ncbi:hypothetical protein HNR00_005067 [Methylorubrum rhodinum]|uniref:MarR family transcriptional regulator n=1 Tax=Methylorubrum rhodinum TaxID=29428 RepID=A0A840ZTD1_9HYPH|nr:MULTISPECIES: hypothetical protein [Methylobacteriaceae]MBB5760318.1 hypothetical protein [Methylorubrum rhodinum]